MGCGFLCDGRFGVPILEAVTPDTAIPYETDWYAWTQQQAARLRELPVSVRPNGLDVENLAEEVEGLEKSQRRAVESLLKQILLHLLKIEHHPAAETRLHWQIEVNAFRDSIEDEFRHSPSLHARQEELAADAWRSAFRLFREELRLRAPEQLRRPGIAALDAEVPAYPAEAALRFGWYPEPREE